MKVLRKPCLNNTVVSVAVDTAVNLVRAFSLSAMAAPLFRATFAFSPRLVNRTASMRRRLRAVCYSAIG
jgi:hypothetical protein